MSIKYRVEEVFVTEGVPEHTFVKPPNYNEVLVDIRRAGKPVIIEGQSGSGKTCTARKILDQLSDKVQYEYLSAKLAKFVLKKIKDKDNAQFECLLESIDKPDPFCA